MHFNEFERFAVFTPFCSQKWILGRIWGERNPAKNMILQDHLPMTDNTVKVDFFMKSQFEYYEEIKRTFPHTMSKDQFYQVAHISKATALYLLQSGLVPCKDSGKKTRRYTIKTTDVIAYLQDRILYPAKYAAPDGWYIGRSTGKVKHREAGVNSIVYFTPEQRTLLQDYFREEMSDFEDLITVKEFADFLGYNPNSVVRWCNKLALKCFNVSGKYLIPKVCAIEFLATDTSLGVRRKSHRHQLFLSDFMNRNGIAR